MNKPSPTPSDRAAVLADEIMHAVRTMAYPEGTIRSLLTSALSERETPATGALAAVLRDADRYRWLRSANSIMPGTPGKHPMEWYCGVDADEAIDKAMAAQEGSNG